MSAAGHSDDDAAAEVLLAQQTHYLVPSDLLVAQTSIHRIPLDSIDLEEHKQHSEEEKEAGRMSSVSTARHCEDVNPTDNTQEMRHKVREEPTEVWGSDTERENAPQEHDRAAARAAGAAAGAGADGWEHMDSLSTTFMDNTDLSLLQPPQSQLEGRHEPLPVLSLDNAFQVLTTNPAVVEQRAALEAREQAEAPEDGTLGGIVKALSFSALPAPTQHTEATSVPKQHPVSSSASAVGPVRLAPLTAPLPLKHSSASRPLHVGPHAHSMGIGMQHQHQTTTAMGNHVGLRMSMELAVPGPTGNGPAGCNGPAAVAAKGNAAGDQPHALRKVSRPSSFGLRK
jgi:hypothetical protein